MKTQGEIEAEICDVISRFELECMGRGPGDIRAHLFGDVLMIRLRDVLTSKERQLVNSLPADKGRDLVKQSRTHIVESARPTLEKLVFNVAGAKVVSLYHDVSTVTGEEFILFTLAESPICRETRKR